MDTDIELILLEIRDELRRAPKVKHHRVSMAIIPANNLLDDYRLFAPDRGYILDVTRIGAQGFTGGSINVFEATTQSEQIITFTAAGSFFTQCKGQIAVRGRNDRLVFQAIGNAAGASISLRGNMVHESEWERYLLG